MRRYVVLQEHRETGGSAADPHYTVVGVFDAHDRGRAIDQAHEAITAQEPDEAKKNAKAAVYRAMTIDTFEPAVQKRVKIRRDLETVEIRGKFPGAPKVRAARADKAPEPEQEAPPAVDPVEETQAAVDAGVLELDAPEAVEAVGEAVPA